MSPSCVDWGYSTGVLWCSSCSSLGFLGGLLVLGLVLELLMPLLGLGTVGFLLFP